MRLCLITLMWSLTALAQDDGICPIIPSTDDADTNTVNLQVPIKRINLYTTDGGLVRVTPRDRSVNFMDLRGRGKGISFMVPVLDAQGKVAPVPTIYFFDSIELETWADGSGAVTGLNGSLCTLQIPAKIQVRIKEPAMVVANANYAIKIAMLPSQLLTFTDEGAACLPGQVLCRMKSSVEAFSVRPVQEEY